MSPCKSTVLEAAPFTDTAFYAALSGVLTQEEVQARPQPPYLLGYLKEIGAKTIVSEDNYVDADYLDDYAAYYSRCHREYKSRCKRLHFFRREISDADLTQALIEPGEAGCRAALRADYLGFIVVRPLPTAVVGRTVLKPYPDNGRRRFPCTYTIESNLFGLNLQVNSLHFQEQDAAVAACATTAIWCALQKAVHLFSIARARSLTITLSANQVQGSARALPSRGLTVEQICAAIQHAGLAPEVVDIQPNTPFVSLLYGYLSMGLPVILGVDVEGIGLHAVALAGYSIERDQVHSTETEADAPFRRIGLRINKLYAHDDQVGPFSKIEICQMKSTPGLVLSGWAHGGGSARALIPRVLIVPLYEKIRLSFIDVQDWAYRLDALMECIVEAPGHCEWDIHLITTNQLKEEIRATLTDPEVLKSVLIRQHPRFIWRLRLRLEQAVAVDLLVDATDLSDAFSIYQAVWHRDEMRLGVKSWLGQDERGDGVRALLGARLFDFMRESTG